jgi:murein hydrolase activator
LFHDPAVSIEWAEMPSTIASRASRRDGSRAKAGGVARAAALVVLLALLWSVAGAGNPVSAAPQPAPPSAQERLARVQRRRAELEREISRLRGQEKSLLAEVERLDLEVRLRTEDLRATQIVLQDANEKMDVVVKRTRQLEGSLAAARPLIEARARSLYKLGELSYVRMVLSIDRPADVFRGYRFVSTLARRDNQRIARFRADLTDLAAARTELERQTAEALRLRADLERARRSLDAERRRKNDRLREIVGRKESQVTFLEELQQAEERVQKLVLGLVSDDVTVPIGVFKGSLPWPTDGKVRAGFGRRKHPRFDTYTHQNGLDIEARPDTPVLAVYDGRVVFAERFLGYGLMVILDHGDKTHTLYGRLSDVYVKPGQHVPAGEPLGTVGTSGLEESGLYFEVRSHGKAEDPSDWLRKRDARS